jgi:hypothetical protein
VSVTRSTRARLPPSKSALNTRSPNRQRASASPGAKPQAAHETGARPSAQGHHRLGGFSGLEDPARSSPDAPGARAPPVARATRPTPDASGIARRGMSEQINVSSSSAFCHPLFAKIRPGIRARDDVAADARARTWSTVS